MELVGTVLGSSSDCCFGSGWDCGGEDEKEDVLWGVRQDGTGQNGFLSLGHEGDVTAMLLRMQQIARWSFTFSAPGLNRDGGGAWAACTEGHAQLGSRDCDALSHVSKCKPRHNHSSPTRPLLSVLIADQQPTRLLNSVASHGRSTSTTTSKVRHPIGPVRASPNKATYTITSNSRNSEEYPGTELLLFPTRNRNNVSNGKCSSTEVTDQRAPAAAPAPSLRLRLSGSKSPRLPRIAVNLNHDDPSHHDHDDST
eukprot:3337806-Rhodomonas_salina.2